MQPPKIGWRVTARQPMPAPSPVWRQLQWHCETWGEVEQLVIHFSRLTLVEIEAFSAPLQIMAGR